MTSTLCQPVSVKDLPLPGLVDKPEVVKVKDLPLQKLLSAQKYWRQFWFWWLKSWRICPYCLCAQSLVLTRLCLSVWSGRVWSWMFPVEAGADVAHFTVANKDFVPRLRMVMHLSEPWAGYQGSPVGQTQRQERCKSKGGMRRVDWQKESYGSVCKERRLVAGGTARWEWKQR